MRIVLCGVCVFAALLLGGCSEGQDNSVMTIVVKKNRLQVEVPATGEVKAAHSTVMSVPGTSRSTQTIAWLMPENSVVKKGEVIAKFDGETYLTQKELTELDLVSANLDTENKSMVIDTEKADIKSDTKIVDKEIEFSDQFNIDDLTVYSKNEIIDALDNREYLDAQRGFLGWKLDNFSVSSAAEMDLMLLKANQYQTKLDQYELALTKLEVHAPHDGILIYEKNWRGEKPRIGQTMWPGTKLARLPDLSNMQAQVFVLESEAGNVQVGNSAEIRLDAKPEQVFKGKVEQKSSIAKSIKSGNPVKYFEVTITIENPDPALVKPGNKVTTTIVGNDRQDVLTVPLQAVFSDDKGSFVYAEVKGKMTKTPVTLGLKNFAEVEIKSGVDEGQKVALFKPVIM